MYSASRSVTICAVLHIEFCFRSRVSSYVGNVSLHCLICIRFHDNKKLKQGHFEMGIHYVNFTPISPEDRPRWWPQEAWCYRAARSPAVHRLVRWRPAVGAGDHDRHQEGGANQQHTGVSSGSLTDRYVIPNV